MKIHEDSHSNCDEIGMQSEPLMFLLNMDDFSLFWEIGLSSG